MSAFGIERCSFESCIERLSQQNRSTSRKSNIQSLPFYGLSHLFMKTHNVVFSGLWAKSNGVTIQMKPFQQYFQIVGLFLRKYYKKVNAVNNNNNNNKNNKRITMIMIVFIAYIYPTACERHASSLLFENASRRKSSHKA